MSVFKSLLKDTFIYGLATVLPRLMSLILVGLHTDVLSTEGFSDNTSFYVYAAFANVFLTYGMETAFFRFFSKSNKDPKVFSTVLIALTTTTIIFFGVCYFNISYLSSFLKIPSTQLLILISILTLDTLAVSAFILYRIQSKALKFAFIKIINLIIYVGLNFFFLKLVPVYNLELPEYLNFQKVEYIFVANLLASLSVFVLILPTYFKFKFTFDKLIFRSLLNYGFPIMIAGIAFVINENLDKLLLKEFLGKSTMGAYSGCYKLTVFLTLFIQAFRMGVEPFIFNQAKNKNAQNTYALVLKFYVIFASLGVLFVLTFLDFFKEIMIRDQSYWYAISIVPIVLLANWCFGAYHTLSVWYKMTDKTYYGMLFSIIGAIVTIAINYLLIPKYGFMVSAYATLCAYGLMMVLSYFQGQRVYYIPYDLKRIGVYAITTLLITCGIIQYQVSFLIKIIGILLYLILVFVFEKQQIKDILKR